MMDSIHKEGRNKWYEALHFNPSSKTWRKPASSNISYNIVRHDKNLELVRFVIAEHYKVGQSKVGFSFNSWYRDPVTNSRVGGATRSRHCQGDGTDLLVYVDGKQIACKTVNQIMRRWCIDNATALASATCFTHIDSRGYFAEWSYGF